MVIDLPPPVLQIATRSIAPSLEFLSGLHISTPVKLGYNSYGKLSSPRSGSDRGNGGFHPWGFPRPLAGGAKEITVTSESACSADNSYAK